MNIHKQAFVLEEEYEVSRDASRRLPLRSTGLQPGNEKLRLFVLFFSSPVALQKMKEKDLDGWENIRGPRPWEDSRQYQDQQRSRQNNQ